MGRKWFEDVVPAMVKLSPTQVQLPAPAHLTIGGQQRHLTAALQLTLTGLSAVTLYYVYAVVSGGVVVLVQSTRVNSLGPVGYASWKLVGALFSDGLASPAFGAFVNLTGKPETDIFPFRPVATSFGTISGQEGFCKVRGDLLFARGKFISDTPLAATAGIGLPGAMQLETGKMNNSQISYLGEMTRATSTNQTLPGGNAGPFPMTARTGTSTELAVGTSTQLSSTHFVVANASSVAVLNDSIGFRYEVPIVGLSNVPLVDR